MTEFEQAVADALAAFRYRDGQEWIGATAAEALAPRVAAAIRAAADKPWMAMPACHVVGTSPSMDYPAAAAALAALRGARRAPAETPHE